MTRKISICLLAVFYLFYLPAGEASPISSGRIDDGTFEVLRQIDSSVYTENPDKTKFFKTTITLEIERPNRQSKKILLDDDIYINDDIGISSIYDPIAKKLTLFVLSYSGASYAMNGFSYRVECQNNSFTKEVVFSKENDGWFSYFGGAESGNPVLWHFSFYNYWQMRSVRNANGTWSTYKEYKIEPSQAAEIFQKRRLFLIASEMDKQTPSESYEEREISVQNEKARVINEKAQKAAWAAELNGKNPQAMYLKAGKLMRNGEKSKATELYEAIIARHAGSVWAVKASDQLDQSQRESSVRESVDRAGRDAAMRAYEQCIHEERRCLGHTNQASCFRNCRSLLN
ncbi:hypothetical protein [Candidatus Symbiobacter mobilis]|uniref:Tetratricopeptide repeat protein n=1 Tax=Candidatus Symbiobacter mobilis CR TaxID=946483 RepID=U5NBX5_9BURK|nr:hypothetical protein [Candidatus Symbiobacter mobilis]AGX87743.1 hypothetical protein Cenrod_1658 [Candidatus Symbiobacter mobilis CR]